MKTVKPLTPKQKKLLESIQSYISDNGFSPTLKDISEMIEGEGEQTSLSTAQYYVETLKNKGYLDKEDGKERGLSLRKNFSQIPLVGIIAAGNPIDPIEEQEFIEVPTAIKLNPALQYFALKVSGDSMIDMGVLDEDIVIIRQQYSAKDNDVVVAITEDGATLKVFRNQKGKIWLEPRNTKYKPIYPKQLEIKGLLEGLIRY